MTKTSYGVRMTRIRRAFVFGTLFGIGWLAMLYRQGRWNLSDVRSAVRIAKEYVEQRFRQ